MRYDTSFRSRASSLFNWSFPDGVKWLVIANVTIYVVAFFYSKLAGDPGNDIYTSLLIDLVPRAVTHGLVWQLVTYLFLHDLTTVWHILFNMLALWMFGAPIEETWGTKRFLQFYFICGVGAGVCVVLANYTPWGNPYQRVIGASGAIYGLLLAFGMLFPDETVLMSFLFPIKAKYMVMIFGAIAFITSFQSSSPVSSLAHLGGMLFGFLYIRSQFGARKRAVSSGFNLDFEHRLREYKLQRARKKFKVYMKKHSSGDDDRWAN